MKNITKTLLLALLLLSFAGGVSAQTFKVDALTKSGTTLYRCDKVELKDNWVDLSGDSIPRLSLVNGTEVLIAPTDTVILNASFRSLSWSLFYKTTTYSGDVVAVTYEGARYYADVDDLVISDKSQYDFINKDGSYHNFWGRLYSSFAPYIAILLLLIAATVFALLVKGNNGPRLIPTILAPVFMLLAIVIEMTGVILMGSDMLWWIDTDVVKWVWVIIRLLLFALAVILQIFSMRLYKNGIVGYAKDPEKKVLVKRPIIGALIGVILLGVCAVIAMFAPKQASLCLTIGAILLVISVLVAIVSTAMVNSKALGTGAGIAFTLFVVIYCIGLVSMVIMFIIGFINAFWGMLVTFLGSTLVLMLMSKVVPARTYTDGNVRYEVYEDFNPFKNLFGKNKS